LTIDTATTRHSTLSLHDALPIYLGGTCVNVGCVPKKLLVYAAQFHESFRDAVGYGWQPTTPAFDWSALIANKNREIERLNGIYGDRKSTRLNSSHVKISYAVFCL